MFIGIIKVKDQNKKVSSLEALKHFVAMLGNQINKIKARVKSSTNFNLKMGPPKELR